MFRKNADGMVVDGTGRMVGVTVDSFAAGLGDVGADAVVIRLYLANWPTPAGLVPKDQVHQFAMPAKRAAALGQALLELAAAAEREAGSTTH